MSGSALKVWFDGGCRPNPGPIEVAAVARGVATFRDDLGSGSNDKAEWLALLHALDLAAELGMGDVILIGDSLSVIQQASGKARCRDMGEHLETFRASSARFGRVRLRHVGRSHNLAGIALERRRNSVQVPIA